MSRESSEPSFWDVRYAREEHLFGTAPSAFVMEHASMIPRGSDVLEIGAGEGRTLVALAKDRDTRGTALDFSPEALHAAERLADANGVALSTLCADVRTWAPSQKWDAVIITFVQLLPEERQALYQIARSCLRPGGVILGQWFRPEHLDGTYDRVGPNRMDRMVPVPELESAFADASFLRCEAAEVTLNEGRLRGRAATAHLMMED